MSASLENRRPIRARDAVWARAAAARLAAKGVSPDAVSACAVAFALAGAAAFVASGVSHGMSRAALLFGAAGAVQGRLLCNLLDGLVAVENGRGGPLGPIWNELPDRIADVLLLVGAGYGAALAGASWAAAAGWAAATLAVLTAYIRELGRALGAPADFGGVGAKPQRMAVLTLAAGLATVEPLWKGRGCSMGTGLAVVTAIAAWTCIERVRRLGKFLRDAAPCGRPLPSCYQGDAT